MDRHGWSREGGFGVSGGAFMYSTMLDHNGLPYMVS
jgi:hypothetical protein